MLMANIARRAAWAAFVACMVVSGARGADAFRIEVREDASVTLADASGSGFCELRLDIVSADGSPARVVRGRGSRKARALVGAEALDLTVEVRDAGGGVVIDFRAAPVIARGDRGPWAVPARFSARVVARLTQRAVGRGSATICGREVVLGPDEIFGPDSLAKAVDGRSKPVHETAEGRTVWIAPEGAAPFCIQGELPGGIELEEPARKGAGEDEIVLRLPATDADTACRLAFAVYMGRRAYAGRPVFLGEPRVEYLPGLRCFEAKVRAFGEWRDAFDHEDVAVEAAWKATPRAGRVSGFYARDLEAKVRETDEGETEETLLELGWPSFRVRLPGAAAGSEVTIAFATKGGRAVARAAAPTNRLALRPGDPEGTRTTAGVTLDPSAWRAVDDAANAVRDLHAARLGMARLPLHEGAWALERDRPGEADLATAWRLDRVFEQALERGVRLVPVLGRGRAADKLAGSSAYFSGDEPLARSAREFFEAPAPRAAFRRMLRYAAARWGAVESLEGWDIFDGPDLMADAAPASALAPWVDSMAGWLKAHDPDHQVFLTLRAGTPSGPFRTAGVAVGRALALALDKASADDPLVVARDAASGAAFLVLESRTPDERPSHAAIWAVATAGAGRGVFFGPGASVEKVAPVIRYLGDGSALGRLPYLLLIEEEGYRVLGRSGPRGAAWWLSRTATEAPKPSAEIDDDEPPAPRFLPVSRGVEFEIDGLVPGRYAVEWWQTHEGRLLTRSEIRAPNGIVLLRAPSFATDVAGRLVRIADKSPSALRE